MLRASVTAERAGIPTVSLISSGFLRLAEATSKSMGVKLPLAVYSGHPMLDAPEQVNAKAREELLPAVIAGLTARRESVPVSGAESEPEPGSIVFAGDLLEVQEHFLQQLWSDGLPIIPPTSERVAEFLSHSPYSREHVIGVLPNEGREATALSVAINGVMAGCRPEYMPVLLAIVDAIADEHFRLEDAGSTPSWEPLVVVSGPIAKRLGFNVGQGVMKVGRQANTSIGRFLRLYMRNVCGFRIPPGDGDKGSIGFTFNVALAEDEDAARRAGWPTLAMDLGFGPDENVVSVMSVVCITAPLYSAGSRAVDHAHQFAEVIKRSFAAWAHVGLRKGIWTPLIIMGPEVAEVIAGEWSKDEFRQYVQSHATLEAGMLEEFSLPATAMPLDLKRLVAEGLLPKSYAESDDPARLLSIVVKPEDICIVVAGDRGRNQSRAYMPNHHQGALTSKRVVLPEGWA